jgi:O-antigen/teichoic acid export membrane protein
VTVEPSTPAAASILRASGVYVAATSASAAVGFLLLPILTRVLTPEDFGVLGLLAATFGILSAVVGLNPTLMVTARFAILSPERIRELISASVPITLATAVVAWITLLFVGRVWSDFRLPNWAFLMLAAMAMVGVYRNVGMTLLQMRHRPKEYAALEIGGAGLGGLLALLLVVGFGLDWRGKFFADAASVIVLGAGLSVYLIRHDFLKLRIPARALRELVVYSAPLTAHALSFWAINAQDRYFVAGMVGVGAVGIYSVAYSFGNILNLVHAGVMRGFAPHFYERARLGEHERREIVRFTYGYVLVSILGWVVFVAATWLLVPAYLGPAFGASVSLIPWVALGYTFNAVRNVMTGYLYIAERTGLIGGLTGSAAVLNAGLNLMFIGWWGTLGAAIATAVTFAFIAALTTVFAVRLHPMPWLRPIR